MRRFASIDFLRGLAIVMMIVLHVVMFTLNRNSLIAAIDIVPMINIIAMLIIVTAGGMAGFFLLVSAIGNSISMEKNYQSGKSPKDVAIKQIVGGIFLLFFAVLSEGVIGYQAFLGEFALRNFDPSVILYRGFHMETIHTIAWCVIVNGIVQWFLARKDGWQKPKRNIRIYVILAVIVVALTPLMWYLASLAIPGYPYAHYNELGLGFTSTLEIKYPLAGYTQFWGYIELFLLAPLASSVEPIFPYLAMSFVGSIIGIVMAQKRDQVPRNFTGKGIRIGGLMLLVGMGGLLVIFIIMLSDSATYGDIGSVLGTLVQLYDHRYYSNIGLLPGMPVHTPEGAWLFQFLFLGGLAICLSLLIIRLVEFRGKGAPFAKKTLWVRRYGFTAFSIYNYQFLYFLPWFIVTVIYQAIIPSTPAYGNRENLDWNGTFIVIALAFLVFEIALRLWERVDFAFGLEWCIGAMAARVLPVKKQTASDRGEKRKWWQVLNAKSALHDVEWLNIVEESEIHHEDLVESKLARKLALIGFIMFPASFMALGIAQKSFRTEQPNKFNKQAKILAIAGIIFVALWMAFAFTFSLADLGLSL